MIRPQVDQANSASPADTGKFQTVQQAIFTLIAATLQASAIDCSCEVCQLIKSRAKDLIPLMDRFTGPEVE